MRLVKRVSGHLSALTILEISTCWPEPSGAALSLSWRKAIMARAMTPPARGRDMATMGVTSEDSILQLSPERDDRGSLCLGVRSLAADDQEPKESMGRLRWGDGGGRQVCDGDRGLRKARGGAREGRGGGCRPVVPRNVRVRGAFPGGRRHRGPLRRGEGFKKEGNKCPESFGSVTPESPIELGPEDVRPVFSLSRVALESKIRRSLELFILYSP